MRCPIIIGLALLALFSISVGSSGGSAQTEQEWTVMVYMANDVPEVLPWEDDINEMERAPANSGVHIVALVDDYYSPETFVLEIEHDARIIDDTIVSLELDVTDPVLGGDANTASSAVLEAFMSFSAEKHPADKYVLVLWGHGGGWYGLCPDGTDMLTIPELSAALAGFKESIGRNIDMVVIDACDEATVEVMYELRKSVDIFIASETSVPDEGLPYDSVLTTLSLNPDLRPEELSAMIVDAYTEWAAYGSAFSTAMVALNLGMADELVGRLSTLAVTVARYDNLYASEFDDALDASESYSLFSTVDLGDFLLELSERATPPEIAFQVFDSLLCYDEMVLAFGKFDHPAPADGIHVRDATGVAIYMPVDDVSEWLYRELEFSKSAWAWMSLRITDDASGIGEDPAPELELSDSDADGFVDTAVISWGAEYDEDESYEVWVFREQGEGLELAAHLESQTPIIAVSDLGGAFLLSTSSTAGSLTEAYARTHALFEVVLYKVVTITIVLEGAELADGEPVLRLVSRDAIVNAQVADDSYLFEIVIPDFSSPDQIVVVQALDPATNEIVGQANVRIPCDDRTYTLNLNAEAEDTRSSGYTTLALAAAAAVIIAASAAVFVLLGRKPRA